MNNTKAGEQPQRTHQPAPVIQFTRQCTRVTKQVRCPAPGWKPGALLCIYHDMQETLSQPPRRYKLAQTQGTVTP